jgi:hypothetical protein
MIGGSNLVGRCCTPVRRCKTSTKRRAPKADCNAFRRKGLQPTPGRSTPQRRVGCQRGHGRRLRETAIGNMIREYVKGGGLSRY